MPRSMTGFGTADGPVAGGRLQCEIRTVNHRHLNVQLRLPTGLQPAEEPVRNLIRDRLERGHVSVAARWTDEPEHDTGIAVDLDRARAVVDALTRLRDTLGLAGEIDVSLVARQPDVLVHQTPARPMIAPDEVLAVASAALDDVIGMREREGAALAAELRRLLDRLDEQLAIVRARAPERVMVERDRLRDAVAELLEGRAPDEDRLAQEIALFADRLDVREEVVRLQAHLAAVRDALAGDGAIGRRLTFLSQEMLREINTIGSKANDAAMAHAAVAMKGVLETFREQVENVE